MPVALFINSHEMRLLALFEKHREMHVTLLKGLLPLVAPLKGLYLLTVAQGKWEPPLVPQIAAIVCLSILTRQTLPPHLYKFTTVYCSFMLEYLAVRFMLGSLVFSPCLCMSGARVNLRSWLHLFGVSHNYLHCH